MNTKTIIVKKAFSLRAFTAAVSAAVLIAGPGITTEARTDPAKSIIGAWETIARGGNRSGDNYTDIKETERAIFEFRANGEMVAQGKEGGAAEFSRYTIRDNIVTFNNIEFEIISLPGDMLLLYSPREGLGMKIARYGKKISATRPATPVEYRIGDRGPAGGWVFYDKGHVEDGWRYLEAAPVDQGADVRWGACTTVRSNIPESVMFIRIGDGRFYTRGIVNHCGRDVPPPVSLCTGYRGGGYDDWFLPSHQELDLMRKNLHAKGMGNFSAVCYWSSSVSEGSPAVAGYIRKAGITCTAGEVVNVNGTCSSDTSYGVRAIRAF